jgi:cbb3-type cytochrome oxidase maturation protein
MDMLYLLIPLSIALVFVIGAVFWWALNRRQFDDLDQAGQSIIEDKDG